MRPLLGSKQEFWRIFLATFMVHVLVIAVLAVATDKGWIFTSDPEQIWLFRIACTILGLAVVAGVSCLFRTRTREIGLGLIAGSALVVLLFYGYGIGIILLWALGGLVGNR